HLSKFLGLNSAFFDDESPVIKDEKIKMWLMEDLKKLSLQITNYSRVKDFIVKRKPFSVESGELTVTLKQKRKLIEENYRIWIEELYQ
ncbi:MAG: hypothetical protein ABI208_05675, partial [Ginsengibacter sp.]